MAKKKSGKISVAIDLGGTNTKIALVDNKANILLRSVTPTSGYKNVDELINGMVEGVLSLIRKKRLKKSNIAGVGIGTPGLVDSLNGVVYGLTNIPFWNNVPIKKIFEKKLKLKTFVDNDVNLMALGEFVHGAGQEVENIICLTLGTGVGGGIILNKRLYRGVSLSAGEIGHMVINEKGPECMCGSFGCLERYVGNRYIIQSAVDKIKAGQKSKITKIVKGNLKAVTPIILEQAAKQGDKLALSVWWETGAHIGTLLSGLVNFLNPEIIVIGGGIANAGRLIFEPIRKTVRQRAMTIPGKRVKILKAKLGDKAGLIGAAVLAARPEFRSS